MRITTILICILLLAITVVAQPREARLVDAFLTVPCGDITGRLDAFIAEWTGNKDERIVVVYYSARYRKTSEFRKRDELVKVLSYPHPDDGLNWAQGIPMYLQARTATDKPVNGLLKERVKLIGGGYREEFAAELWLVPPGADDPKPTLLPTIAETEVKFGAKRPRSIPDYINCYAGI